ncbi:hypothetical protein SacmaDRAFT_4262 [Saccharomonospora marina XMU15]|uniref:DUF4304 domain-containing protein n=2 Tax=Saccharomonospora TaxID=1851 RepID=H5X7V0_9PSEU|nr:hypothetical protein SacmaDRAFT_4262 [Saccharomonospora marina XMU15]
MPTIPAMGQAQDRFARLVKSMWGPALRELGFTGSGRVWTLADPIDWAMLGFQTSTASTSDQAKFTINLLVVGKAAWDDARAQHPWYSARPSPNTIALHRYAQRSGPLICGADHWWHLAGDGSNEDEIRDEVLCALRAVIVPKLKAELADRTPGPRGRFEKLRCD